MTEKFIKNIGNSLSKVTQAAAGKTENLIDSSKISSKISSEQRQIDKLYQKIGEKVAAQFDQLGANFDDETVEAVSSVKESFAKIAALREAYAETKGKKICPSCSELIDSSAMFCPMCGTRLPEKKIVVEEIVGEAVDESDEPTEEIVGEAVEEPADEAAAELIDETAEEKIAADQAEPHLEENAETAVSDQTVLENSADYAASKVQNLTKAEAAADEECVEAVCAETTEASDEIRDIVEEASNVDDAAVSETPAGAEIASEAATEAGVKKDAGTTKIEVDKVIKGAESAVKKAAGLVGSVFGTLISAAAKAEKKAAEETAEGKETAEQAVETEKTAGPAEEAAEAVAEVTEAVEAVAEVTEVVEAVVEVTEAVQADESAVITDLDEAADTISNEKAEEIIRDVVNSEPESSIES